MKKNIYIYAILIAFTFSLSLLLEHSISGFPSIKWTHIRYCLFMSILLPPLLLRFNNVGRVKFYALMIFISTVIPLEHTLLKKKLLNGEFIWDEITFSITLLLGLYILEYFLHLFLDKKYCFIISSVCDLLLLLPYLTCLIYSIATGDVFDTNSLIAIMQTNFKESIEFLTSTIPLYIIIATPIAIAIIYNTLYVVNTNININKFSESKITTLFSFIAIIACLIIGNKVIHYGYFYVIYADSKEYIYAINNFKKMRYTNDGKLKPLDVVNDPNISGSYLVIIGESENRQHMNAFGYARNTTPWLSSKLNDNNFVIMNNGFSCHTLTMLVVSQAITQANQYYNKKFNNAYSLVDIAKAAGYKTYWISNQGQFGSYSTPITLMANEADNNYFLNDGSAGSSKYDIEVINKMKKIPNDTKKVIFIHLNGSHWEYKNRYPHDEFSTFTNSAGLENKKYVDIDKVNEYDNSVFYTDHVLKNIFKFAQKEWDVDSIVYFSDHGEAVMSDKKHIPGLFEIDMAKIPVVFYFSNKYLAKYNNKNYKQYVNRYFTNDMMFDTILNTWGIKTSYYNKKLDFLSHTYGFGKDNLKIMDNKINIE